MVSKHWFWQTLILRWLRPRTDSPWLPSEVTWSCSDPSGRETLGGSPGIWVCASRACGSPAAASLHSVCILRHFRCVWLRPFGGLTLRPFCSPPGSSVQGLLQARIPEWVAMPASRGSSPPKDWTCLSYVSCIDRRVLYHWATCEAAAGVNDSVSLSPIHSGGLARREPLAGSRQSQVAPPTLPGVPGNPGVGWRTHASSAAASGGLAGSTVNLGIRTLRLSDHIPRSVW